jgi:hypothetical protein
VPSVAGGPRDEDRRLAPALAIDLAALGQNHATASELNAPRAASEGGLHATADGQITGLIDLVSTLDETMLRLQCPGREKHGDGTVARARGTRQTTTNGSRPSSRPATGCQPWVGPAGRSSNPSVPPSLATDPQTTANTARAPANTRTSTRQAPSISTPWSNSFQPRAALSGKSPSSPTPSWTRSHRWTDPGSATGNGPSNRSLGSLLRHQSHQVAALKAATP